MAETANAIPDTTLPLPPAKAKVTTPTPVTSVPSDITAIRTPEELRRIADQTVGADLEGQINPLKNQVGTLQGREDANLAGIRDMFGSILPFSAGAAERVGTAYDTAEKQQQSIFSQATIRMNQLRQSRAQEAQALAQEIGGPVSVGEFTDSMGFEPEALANLGAGQQLHTLQYGMADVGLANAFAGRVLPLVQSEETAKARKYYEDQITEIQKQITSLQSTKTSKVNAAANDLQVKEREYALQKNQQALDKLKADHDWAATQRTLRNEETRINMAKDQFKLDRAGVTGVLNGKPTLAAKQLSAQERQQAAALNMSNKEYLLRKNQLAQNATQASKKLALAQAATWAQYLDAAVNPQVGKTVTTSHAVSVDATAAQTGKVKDAYVDKASPTGYSRIVKVVETPVSDPITDPTQLVDYLESHNVPRKNAVAMVKKRLGLPASWKYGEDPNAPPTGTESPNRP